MSKVLKRGASAGLTRDNWEDEDPAEEMGVFQKASTNELKSRPMIKARRRGDTKESGSESSVFKNFSLVGSGTSGTSPPAFNFLSNKSPSKSSSSLFNSNSSSLSMGAQKPSFSFGLKNDKKNDGESSESLIVKTNEVQNNSTFASIPNSPPEFKTSAKLNSLPVVNKPNLPMPEGSKNSESRDAYLSNLKGLNLALLNWIKLHIEKSVFINMTPIFDDYKTHIVGLKKKYNCDKDVECGNEVTVSPFVDNLSSSTFSKSISSSSTKMPLFLSKDTNGKSDVTVENKESKAPEFNFGNKNTFQTGNSNSSMFSFGSASSKASFSFGSPADSPKETSQTSSDKPAAPFSFGLGKENSFSFGAKEKTKEIVQATENSTEDSYEPPKVEVNEVKEDNAIYEKKCKLYYKKEDAYVDRGVGTLYLKSVEEKTQLLVRASTNLGTILLNIVLNESLPTQRVGKNNVLIVCIPNPPINPKDASTPVSMLIRVKTSDDADDLLEIIGKHKKSTN